MFRTIWSTLVGLLIEDGQLAIGALLALAITWAIASSGGDQGRDVSGWVLLVIVLVLVVANLSRNVQYVPHGVDYEHFAEALRPGPLPEDLANIPQPRVGFFGLIHEWVDTDLIARLADVLPYSFVVIGSAEAPKFGW